jgi:hypothetical protein
MTYRPRAPLNLLLMLGAAGCSDYELNPGIDPATTGEAQIEVEPVLLDFWEAGPDESVVQSFAVRNVGPSLLSVDTLVVEGSGDFTLLDAADGFDLEPGEEQDFEVEFTPTAAGQGEASIPVRSNDLDDPEVPVDLLGRGLLPSLQIEPDPHDFGDIGLSCADEVQLTLQNVGDDDLIVSELSFEGDLGLSLLEAPALPLTLVPGDWTTATVGATGDVLGAMSGLLWTSSNDPRVEVTATQMASVVAGAEVVDTFAVDADPPVDLLVAVDQSGSMDDDASLLGANFGALIAQLEAGTSDWRVGVVTLDSGCFNGGVLAPDGADNATTFAAAVVEGEDREIDDDERLFQLADRALGQVGAGECNEGFLRSGAVLSLVFVSDEPEQSHDEVSAWTWDFWVARWVTLTGAEPLVRVNGVVDLDLCNEGADGYSEAIAATGGVALSICDADWVAHAGDLASATTAFLYRFPLSADPEPSTLVVRVDGVETTQLWEYDEALNAVVFEALPGGSAVEVQYSVAVECP